MTSEKEFIRAADFLERAFGNWVSNAMAVQKTYAPSGITRHYIALELLDGERDIEICIDGMSLLGIVALAAQEIERKLREAVQ